MRRVAGIGRRCPEWARYTSTRDTFGGASATASFKGPRRADRRRVETRRIRRCRKTREKASDTCNPPSAESSSFLFWDCSPENIPRRVPAGWVLTAGPALIFIGICRFFYGEGRRGGVSWV